MTKLVERKLLIIAYQVLLFIVHTSVLSNQLEKTFSVNRPFTVYLALNRAVAMFLLVSNEAELGTVLADKVLDGSPPSMDKNGNTSIMDKDRWTSNMDKDEIYSHQHNRALQDMVNKNERKLIGIDGYWYNITNFIPYHPGGEVIEQFVGKDASSVFHAFHKESVLKHRKPYSRMKDGEQRRSDINEAFSELGKYFQRNGYFNTSYYWYSLKFLLTFLLLITCIGFLKIFPDSVYKYVGAVALAAFWQQCGFFMHDFEHNQFSHNRHVDQWLGTFFGTMCFGISGSWWREEHFIHHALTTCVDEATNFADPQMMEPVIWAQNQKLWPFYRSKLSYFCVKIQHITFIPICVIAGRVAILWGSMASERRPAEWLALLFHFFWIYHLLCDLPTTKDILSVYAVAAILQGVLHVQLLISHYAKSFHDVKDISTNIDWYQMQVESNIDIVTPWWFDWFHGGLNFHLVHHLYPRMPRHNFRKATAHVAKVCKEHNLVYDHCGWFEAVSRTLSQLKLMSKHFTLDPR